MRSKNGFTLIEILVVIAIIGILAAIIAPNAFNAIEKAKISKAISDLHTLKTASLMYYSDVGFWPPDVNRGIDPGFTHPYPWDPSTGNENPGLANPNTIPNDWTDVIDEKWDGPYIEKWPLTHPWGSTFAGPPEGEVYDYENWPNPIGPNNFRGIAVSLKNLPLRVFNRLLSLSEQGKFPYTLIDTSYGGNYHVSAQLEEF